MTAPDVELVGETTLADAAARARRGEYEAALHLLDEAGTDGPAQWDLRARIEAQRGELRAADAAWQRVLDTVPDDPAALAGRRMIDRIERGRRRRRPVPVLLPGLVVLLLLAGGAVAAGVTADRSAGHPRPASTARAGDDALRRRVRALESQRARQQAADVRARRRLTDLATVLGGDQVRITRRQQDVQVVFDHGLFPPNGTHPTAAGRRALATWGRRLAGQQVRVTVLGHEALLGGDTTAGGSVFEVARATEAAAVLSAASGLPLATFAAAGAERSAAPYPGSGPAGQAGNRTVTLLVAPA